MTVFPRIGQGWKACPQRSHRVPHPRSGERYRGWTPPCSIPVPGGLHLHNHIRNRVDSRFYPLLKVVFGTWHVAWTVTPGDGARVTDSRPVPHAAGGRLPAPLPDF